MTRKKQSICEFIDSLPAERLNENLEMAVLSTGGSTDVVNVGCTNTCTNQSECTNTKCTVNTSECVKPGPVNNCGSTNGISSTIECKN